MWDPYFPVWVLVLLVVFLTASVLFSVYSGRLIHARKKRWTLAFLRCIAFVGVLFFICRPTLKFSESKISPGVFAVLVDRSASMSIKAQDKTRYDRAIEGLAAVNVSVKSRFENQDIKTFGFGEDLVTEDPGKMDVTAPGFFLPETNIWNALQEVKAKALMGRDNLHAVFLFSDGADHGFLRSEWQNTQDLKSLETFPAPIFTFQPGAYAGLRDLRIREVRFNDFGFVKTPMNLAVDIEMEGLEEKNVAVSLFHGRDLVTNQMVNLKPEAGTGLVKTTINLSFSPKDLGDQIYSVKVPVFDEEEVKENNQKSFVIRVIRDKIRVLHVAGRPSWDVKFLRLALKADPNVDLIAFYILRNREDAVEESDQSELSLIPFPHHELFGPELKTFDAVIFQNFNYTQFFPAVYIENVKKYVEAGGGFWMIGGENSFGGGNYQNTPLMDVLPFDFTVNQFFRRKNRAVLTAEGERHPVTRLTNDRIQNRNIWEQLPEMDTINPMSSVKKDAVVLLRTKGADALPLLALYEAGKGRTLALATESMWQWQFSRSGKGAALEESRQFIKNALRFLVGDPTEGLVEVEMKKNRFLKREEVQAIVKARTRNYEVNAKTQVKIEIEDFDTGKIINEQKLVADQEGRVTVTWKPMGDGSFILKASVDLPQGGVAKGQGVFLVEGQTNEWVDPAIQDQFLKKIAEKTGGQSFVLPLKNFEAQIKPKLSYDVVHQKKFPLYKTIELFLLIFTFLAVEWWYRRRLGLS